MSCRTLRPFVLLTLALCAFVPVTDSVSAQMPNGGPEIVIEPDPNPDNCPVRKPAVSRVDGREVWLWQAGFRADAGFFAPGATQPNPQTTLLPRTFNVGLDDNGLVTWVVHPQDGALQLRQVNLATGNASSSRAAIPLGGSTSGPDLAVADAGHMLVVWEETSGFGFFVTFASFGQHADANGNLQGEPFVIQSSAGPGTGSVPPRVVALADGSFVVLWTNGSQPSKLLAARVPAGGEIGTPVEVAGDASWLEAASWPGGLVLAWRARGGAETRLVGRILSNDLETVAEIGPIEAGPAFAFTEVPDQLSVAASGGGTLALVWRDGAHLFGRLFNPQGDPLIPITRVDLDGDGVSRHPYATFGDDGVLTVVWDQGPVAPPSSESTCAGAVGTSIRGRRFATASGCAPGALCLLDERFEVSVAWDDPINGGSGIGTPVPVTDDTGAFWFFDAENLELMVKVLDGTAVNDHYWVFFGSLTNVAFELTVRDRLLGRVKTYVNPPFTFASQGDTTAFPRSGQP